MSLYLLLTFWLFIILLLGLRPDSIDAAECWPNQPADKTARINKKIVSLFVFLTFLFLWILTAFRSPQIGNDTQNYLWYFTHFAKGLDSSSAIEIGYQYFNFLLGKIIHDEHTFLIIMASIMYGGVGLYIHRFSKNPAISLCLFYSFFFSVFASMFRQGTAMVIALYGYQLLKNGKKFPAALLFLLATSFHTTAIVCFFLFMDFKIFGKPLFVLGMTALCAVVSLSGVLRMVVGAVLPRYLHYFDGQYFSSGWLAISFYLIFYILLYFLINKSLFDQYKPDKIVATNFSLLLILTSFGFAVNLFERAGEYFFLTAISEIPNMLYRGKVKNYRIWLFFVCTVMLIMFILILIFRPGWNHLYPYEFWH